MARSDAFSAKFGRRPDISTISDRFFDENLIDFFERLLDDRRSLDDTFIVSARMRDVEKTLKNLDRAHKIRVRRRFADPRSRRHGLQTTSKIHRKIEGKLERKNDRKTGRKSRLGTPQNRRLGRPGASRVTQNRARVALFARPNANSRAKFIVFFLKWVRASQSEREKRVRSHQRSANAPVDPSPLLVISIKIPHTLIPVYPYTLVPLYSWILIPVYHYTHITM